MGDRWGRVVLGASVVAAWGCGPVGSDEFAWTSGTPTSGIDSSGSGAVDGSEDEGTTGETSQSGGLEASDGGESSPGSTDESTGPDPDTGTSESGGAESSSEGGCWPEVEVCDTVDNDCDGDIDEADPSVDLPCSTGGLGICDPGTYVCAAGSLVCRPVAIASPDLCDGQDNDCDGAVDEGDPSVGLGCGTGALGACSAGTLVCGSQGLVCQAITLASPEVCDDIDNDCNGQTDEHALDIFTAYTSFELQTGTGLHETNATWEFEIASNNDIFAINRQGGGGTTEVHVLSAASGYQTFSLHASTALGAVGNTWTFALAPNRDLFAISKSGTGTGTTELHVLSASTDYQTFSLHTGTAFHETDGDYEFFVAPNRDVMVVKKRFTGTGSTEVHVLSAASGYQGFSLNTGTALEPTDAAWTFALAPNSDLFAIRRRGTGTCSTEVHVLTAASNYTAFSLRTGTALGETDDTYDFGVGPNQRVFGLKKSLTGTASTEVHLLRP